MGAVRDILYSRMGGKFSTPFLALLIKRLYMASPSAGPSYEELTVSGNAPLTLENAVAKAIKSITQTGLCAQASTPTPSAPVDIKCNNGALKVRKQSGLPLAYKKVEYIEGTEDGQYIDTGFNILSNDVTYSAHYRLMPTGCTSYGSTTSNQWGYMGMNAAFMLAWTGTNGIGVSSGGAPYVEGHIYEVTHNRGIGGTRTLRVDDIDIELSTTSTTYPDRPFGIFRLSPFATTYNKIWGRIYEFQGYVDGVLTHDLVPVVRLSDNAAGLYNKVNGDFLTNAGTGTFLVGNDISDPIEIYADGTPEVLSVGGKNLNGGTIEHIGFTSTGGSSTSDTFAGTGTIIPCVAGEKYTVSFGGFTTSGISGVFVNTWKTDGTFNLRQAISSTGETTFTIPNGVNKVNFTLYKTGGATIDSTSWMQVERGASATPYEPYVEPQTASVVNLLSAGNYADTQEIISGAVNRKVGIKVFDGSETVTSSSGGTWATPINDKLKSKVFMWCSHYPYSSESAANAPDKSFVGYSSQNIGFKDSDFTQSTDVKAFFKDQYAAGTPVIVIYPLIEETAESVAGQSLSTVAGTNVVSVTAEVSPVALEAVYYGSEE